MTPDEDPLARIFASYHQEVAGSVEPASEQVHRMATRAKRVRSAGIVLAAVVAMAASLGVVALVRGNPNGTTPVTSTTGSALPSPSREPSRTPVPSGSPVAQAPCTNATVPTDNGPSPGPGLDRQDAPNTGPLYYLQSPGNAAPATLSLVAWTPGAPAAKKVLSLPTLAWTNANVSPNHRWVSWVTGGGDLRIDPLDGSGGGRVLAHSVDGTLLEPVWANDSTRLLVRDTTSGTVGTVAVPDGTFVALKQNLPAGARHAVWAADGSAIAFVTADGGITVAATDGTNRRSVAVGDTDFAKTGRRVISLGSLSTTTNGQMQITAAVTEPYERPQSCRSLVTNVVVRVGDIMTLPGRGPQMDTMYVRLQAIYREPGFTTVRRDLRSTRILGLTGGNGEYLGAMYEPSALATYLLLG